MDFDARIAELEARVERIERDLHRGGPSPAASLGESTFWLLQELRARERPGGSVAFGGTMPASGGALEWQIERGIDDLLEESWEQNAAVLAAIASPIRLAVLRTCLGESLTAAQIGERSDAGSTGGLYHHLGQLTGAGWLAQTARGRYTVRPERVIPLLAVIAATSR